MIFFKFILNVLNYFSGTRIVYERSFLMSLAHSPISQTPPKCGLPAALLKNPGLGNVKETKPSQPAKETRSNSFDETQETFSMDL